MSTTHCPTLGTPLAFDEPLELLARLRARYEEPHRRYHDWSHVLACFRARDRLTSEKHPAVDLALLFHDAVYEPLAQDNEERSAELLVDEGRHAGFGSVLLARAADLVLTTKRHDAALEDEEASLVLDADLSILGSDAPAYAAYELAIRQEYAMVPDDAFAAGRAKVLHGLLEKPWIYRTARGRERWEAAAHRNLLRALASLEEFGAGS